MHQDQIKADLKAQSEKGTPIPAMEILNEVSKNKDFFDAHPLAKGFGML